MSLHLHTIRKSAVHRHVSLAILLAGGLVAGSCGGDVPVTDAEAEVHSETEGVTLDTVAIRLSGIQLAVVDSVTTTGLEVTGSITYDANRVSHIGARTNGRIVQMRADLGTRVAAGQVLVILESAAIGQLRAEERQFEELVRIARENHAREQRLSEQGISSRKELLDAEAELRRNEAALRSAEEQLRVLGAGHGTDGQFGVGGQFGVAAPFAGVVVAREASLGEMADPSDTLFTVADLSRLWIELDIFERDLANVRTGQTVTVAVTAYPGRTFPGRIVYVGAIVDPVKRTVRARVEIPNPGGALKPGMFATATVQVGGTGAASAVVPQSAVQELQGRKVVFVPGDAAGEFRPVRVVVGATLDGDRIIILSGLAPGSRVVTTGAFALRSELAKGEIDDH
ncbi:MAG: efflux RND transporter periplasmic adaptor subunit [Gemmatimonadales bacterium]|nr:efflux RND transporter periplasmic adaptor subunit [Gemmatimonadales bacterium]